MIKAKTLVVVLALIACLPLIRGHGDEPKKPSSKVSELMKRKLAHSQKVLEGVAIGDFTKIANNAEELIAVSKEAEWKSLKTPQYEMYSNEFRRNAEALVKKAKEKNIDGAALAYVELTLTCVKCHKHVREEREVRLDGRPGSEIGLLAAHK